MKLSSVAVLVLAVVAAGMLITQIRSSNAMKVDLVTAQKFAEWRNTYGKLYTTPAEADYRLQVFSDQLEFVDHSNREYETAVSSKGEVLSGPMFELNAFGDLTSEEFGAKFTGGRLSDHETLEKPAFDASTFGDSITPEIEPLGQTSFVPRIRQQGSCGSCWAFATIVEVERALFLKQNAYIDLSHQELVDCDSLNGGCQGGWPEHAFSYITTNGIHKASDYPYIGAKGGCKRSLPSAIKFSNFNHAPFRPWTKTYSEALNKRQIHSAVGVYSSGKFRYLSKTDDVFDASLSGECGTGMNHLVAQRSFSNNVALIVNSWGTSWGNKGLKRIKACSSSNLWGTGARLAHPYKA